MSDILRIGLLGLGRIGKLHGENIINSVPGARLEAVADVFLSNEMKEWAAAKGLTKVGTDPLAVIGDPDVDAVFICSSTASHAEFIIAAANAGKHIFCEKPIHTEPEKIIEALEYVEKAGVKLQVGFVRRFDHNHRKVRETVASGKIGAPHIVKVTSRDPDIAPIEYIKTSGGIFLDMTIHDFDMVRYLSGSEAVEIMAYGAVRISPEIAAFGDVDTALITMTLENGALAVIDNSRRACYGYDQRTEVHGDLGCVRVENDLVDMSSISTADGVESGKPTWFFLERYNQAFIDEVIDFVNAVRSGTDVPVTGNDGLMPVYMALAAEKSLKEARPVKLEEVIG